MQPFTTSQRTQSLARLQNQIFDVLVIGGGVTGAGVALDAATRGYQVALVEKSDFASGTSSKSTKLVHGGIRYLPNFDFGLVYEALTERGLLLQNASFLAHPIAFVLPIYEGDRHPVGIPFTTPGGIGLGQLLNAGLWLYDLMAGKNKIKPHRHLSRQEVLREAPALAPQGLKEGFVYYDGQTNDARLTLTLLQTAASYGAKIANYAEMTRFLLEDGKVCGAIIHDRIGDSQISVRARHVVNATGVFTEEIEALASPEPQVQIEPSKGVHLVFSREDLPMGDSAVVLPETDDKRILFIVPWESRVILGTTDTGSGDLNHPTANRDDIAYLLDHLNRHIPKPLTTAQIVSVYAGYRPLVKARTTNHSNAQLSRTHTVLQSSTGLVSVTGGKLTTYRRMAQDTVDVLSKRDGSALTRLTKNLSLQGNTGWQNQRPELERAATALGLAPDIIAQLGRCYGTAMRRLLTLVEQEPTLSKRLVEDLPYIQAAVVYACRHEMAQTPFDVLAHRTSILIEDRQQGLTCLATVAALMGRELHWSAQQQQQHIDTYRASIEQKQAHEITV